MVAKSKLSRRQFLKSAATAGAGLALGASSRAFGAPAFLQQRELNFIGWNNPFFETLNQEFEADTGIHINYDIFPARWDDVMQRFTLWGQTGYSGIDVIFADDLIGGLWSANGWAEDLSSLSAWTDHSDDVADGVLQLNNAVGGVYRAFFFLGLELFYHNRDLVPTPPTSWEELVTIGQSVTDPANDVWGWRPLAGQGHVFNTMLLVLNQAGADMETLADPATLEALRFAQDWVLTHRITPPSTVSEDVNSVMALAAAGKAAMWWNYDGQYQGAMDIDQSVLTPQNLGVARYPMGPASDRGLIHAWGWMIPAASQKKDLAAEFVNWLSRTEILKRINIELSLPPALNSVYNDADIIQQLPLVSAGPGWAELIRDARFREPIVTRPQVTELWGMFENLGKFVMSGEMTPEAAQAWVVQEYNVIKGT